MVYERAKEIAGIPGNYGVSYNRMDVDQPVRVTNTCRTHTCVCLCTHTCLHAHTLICYRMPLSQAEQKFLSMELKFRQNLKQLITESAPRFSLDSLTYASFVAQFGYKTTVSGSTVWNEQRSWVID